MNPVFNELDHRLSVVKRWGVVHTLQTQSVAEHCLNVERIAVRIAANWFHIEDCVLLYSISQHALHHDDLEAVMGDPPNYTKKYIDEGRMANDFDHVVKHAPTGPDIVSKIVKLADLIEAALFLAMEIKLGNTFIRNHLIGCQTAAVKYAKDLGVNNRVNRLFAAYEDEASRKYTNDETS